jgi:hypothetical protein
MTLSKNNILVSLLSHLALFTVIGFSLGPTPSMIDHGYVSFVGSILNDHDLAWRLNVRQARRMAAAPKIVVRQKAQAGIVREPSRVSGAYFAAPLNFASAHDKLTFVKRDIPVPSSVSGHKDSVVIFHPVFPSHFLLYFRHRQAVHIELLFNISPRDKSNYLKIKRKISSGNLEADLLSMRYISHYLFLQETRFPINTWETVEIDLSPKDDRYHD